MPSAPQRGGDISGLESPVLDDIDFFGGGKMSGNGPSSPFIKDEPDWEFGSMPRQQHFNMHMQNQQYPQVASGSIDPNDLQAHHQNDNFGGFSFNQPPNMTGSFNLGNSGIGDEELASLDLRQNPSDRMSEFTFDQPQPSNQPQHVLSSTPNGEPLQSPYLQGNFPFYQQGGQMVSPRMRPQSQGPIDGFNFNGPRRSLPHNMERKASDQRSPMTPKTQALAGLTFSGTPESGSYGSQPMSALSHRHQKSLSGQWDQSPASLSYMDSPLASPSGANHAAISEVLKSGKGMSLPNKVDSHGSPAYQTQEAKRRRRRESHNLVERRRRDNINERIQELSHLVPQHRLEDEKVRKYLANNGPLSPSIHPTGVSPPQAATSMLAAGGRRATGPGSLAMGLPSVDDKDKGPNKGDILNGSVSWTRDLMWSLHKKLEQEAQLKTMIEGLGGTFPFSDTDDDARLRTELQDAMDKNDASTFAYSRGHGSGLRVPKHTDYNGNPASHGTQSPQDMSPRQGSSASGGEGSFWTGNGGHEPLKEEDEFEMSMS